MQKLMKIFLLAVTLLVAAFFANRYGLVSIPWLQFNSVTTYGDDAIQADQAAKKALE